MKIEYLETKYMGQEIEYHEEIDSTNIRAKDWARAGAKQGSLVIAEYQSAGKGRLGRNWLSPKGIGIWMSIVLRPCLDISKIPQLTLVAGFCMSKAVQNITNLETKIKWPNDIIVNDKKVAGILTELNANVKGINFAVVGVGVNVNNQELDESIPYATSLAIQGKQLYRREEIIREFLTIFEVYYEQYVKENSIAFLLEDYKKKCVNLNKEVRILTGQEEYIAYVEDINNEGSLQIRKMDGSREIIFTGEVSVRGLYGYV